MAERKTSIPEEDDEEEQKTEENEQKDEEKETKGQTKTASPKKAKKRYRKGHDWESISDPEKFKQHTCGLCGNLVRDAVELACRTHLQDSSFRPAKYCEGAPRPLFLALPQPTLLTLPHKQTKKECLQKYLDEHDQKCPIGGHENCEHQRLISVRFEVYQAKCKCPRHVNVCRKAGILNPKQVCRWDGTIGDLDVKFTPLFSLLGHFSPPFSAGTLSGTLPLSCQTSITRLPPPFSLNKSSQ